ncbi:hypothetical protein [Pantanalinema sp. GBBB05]|uniref:hypothetical protein n=1 Tax=Pantanalinema sp. GBBB05 TaxID=2604139 RepID=UPI001DBF08FB|nr:hypothetical protein [Pantanalinema sp. GBBB05]
MSELTAWYIVKQPNGQCAIQPHSQLGEASTTQAEERWGPYASEQEAIARRVGLIRAGKCQPV